MNPTPRLRFVERSLPMHPFYKSIDAHGNTVQAVQTIRVLQQWYTYDIEYPMTKGEWKDVPLEIEQ